MENNSMSACEKVINTVELLDAILVHVPLQQVILLQRVSKAFYNHIRGSTTIAQNLHFAPKQNVHPSQTTIVFSVLEPLHRIFKDLTVGISYATPCEDSLCIRIFREPAFRADLKKGEEIGSRGDMLVVQSPVNEIVLRTYTRDPGERLCCEVGITLRFIMEAAVRFFEDCNMEPYVEIVVPVKRDRRHGFNGVCSLNRRRLEPYTFNALVRRNGRERMHSQGFP